MLRDHNPSILFGRTKSGTLRLQITPEGLWYDCDLPDTQEGHSARVAVERGDVDGCSFGFNCKRDEWSKEGDVITRSLLDVDLFDVSIVTYPAYKEGTSVNLRSINMIQTFDKMKRNRLKLRLLELDSE